MCPKDEVKEVNTICRSIHCSRGCCCVTSTRQLVTQDQPGDCWQLHGAHPPQQLACHKHQRATWGSPAFLPAGNRAATATSQRSATAPTRSALQVSDSRWHACATAPPPPAPPFLTSMPCCLQTLSSQTPRSAGRRLESATSQTTAMERTRAALVRVVGAGCLPVAAQPMPVPSNTDDVSDARGTLCLAQRMACVP
jgi:hypothetical protein